VRGERIKLRRAVHYFPPFGMTEPFYTLKELFLINNNEGKGWLVADVKTVRPYQLGWLD
jgi:hypothetical protein